MTPGVCVPTTGEGGMLGWGTNVRHATSKKTKTTNKRRITAIIAMFKLIQVILSIHLIGGTRQLINQAAG